MLNGNYNVIVNVKRQLGNKITIMIIDCFITSQSMSNDYYIIGNFKR